MSVSVLFLRFVCAELERRGLDAGPALAACPVGASQLVDLRYAVSVEDLAAVLGEAHELTGDQALGLAVARRPPEETLSILAHLALAAPSVELAFEAMAQHTRLLGEGVRLAWSTGSGWGQLALHVDGMSGGAAVRFCSEVVLGSALALLRRMVPPARAELAELQVGYAAPAYAAEYVRSFEHTLSFDAACTTLRLPLVKGSQPYADTAMYEVLSEAASALMAGAGKQASFGDNLRSVLSREPNLCEASMAALARSMGVTQRTFRRRLAAEGLRVSDLLKEALCARACEELLRSDRSIKEVAEQLGYSEPSAFHRAFRSWTGKTPAAFVREGKSGRAGLRLPPGPSRDPS